MNTNTQEALAKVASISETLECFAKSISMQKITIFPITMIGSHEAGSHERVDATAYQDDYHDDILAMIDQDEAEGENLGCCAGCMDCLGLSWKDFL